MIINNNLLAYNAQRQSKNNSVSKQKIAERLGTGYKINRSSDNAAGLSISEGMQSQIRGLQRGVINCQDGISLCQVADGAMSEIDSMIHRISELCVQSANDTYTDSDREMIDMEIQQIKHEIDRIGNETEYNTIQVLQGGSNPTGKYVEKNITKYKTEYVKETQIVPRQVEIGERAVQDSTQNTNWSKYFPEKVGVDYRWDTLQNSRLAKQYRYYYAIDFKRVTSQEIWGDINHTSLTYTCPQQCSQKFSIYFDNSSNGIRDITQYDKWPTGSDYINYEFAVGTKDYESGQDFLDDITSFMTEVFHKDTVGSKDSVGHQKNLQLITDIWLYIMVLQGIIR